MKERPILFSAAMVRAILEGRKTQTRRVIKPQPLKGSRLWQGIINGYQAWTMHPSQGEKGVHFERKCPYGEPGDRLWLREKFALECPYEHADGCGNPDHVVYWAAENAIVRASITSRWHPSIHMPRWASRINLEIVDVRAQRLQAITHEDIEAEGISKSLCIYRDEEGFKDFDTEEHRFLFEELWDSINARRGFGWHINPWVWVIEFKPI